MEGLELNSRGFYLMDKNTGFPVWSKAADEPVPVASLTKIMTTYLTLATRKLDEQVIITSEMLAGLEEFAVIGLKVGQVVTVEDLLYATMLPSAGDAAQALAISKLGSIENFAAWMNEVAAEFGMKNTHFSNPVGLDAENYSTPADIAILLREALENPTFVTIFETYERDLPSIGKVAKKTFPEMDYILGGKTGYTNAAGRCLASMAEVEGWPYILVTVGAPVEGTSHLTDAETIYRALEENYDPVRIMTAGEKLMRIRVEGSPVKALEFSAIDNIEVLLPNGVTAADLTYDYEGDTEIQCDIDYSERIVGTYTVRHGERILAKKAIVLENSCVGMHEYCVEMPKSYHYEWIGIGGAISLALLGLTIWSFARKKRQTHNKSSRIMQLFSLAALIVSIIANILIFGSWFINNETTEAYPTNLIMLNPDTTSTKIYE